MGSKCNRCKTIHFGDSGDLRPVVDVTAFEMNEITVNIYDEIACSSIYRDGLRASAHNGEQTH